MFNFKYNLYILVVSVICLCACNSSSRLAKINLVRNYPSSQDFVKEAVIYHYAADSSAVYFKVNTSQLLFRKDNDDFNALLHIHYEILPDFNTRHILDSGSVEVVYHDSLRTEDSTDVFSFACKTGMTGCMNIFFTDIHRNVSKQIILNIDKTDSRNRQFHLLVTNKPLIRPYISPGETFHLLRPDTPLFYHVRCYFREFPVASLPFKIVDEQFSYACDSSFNIRPADIPLLNIERKGFYHFLTDTNSKTGFTLYVFDEDYPLITSTAQLAPPVRYITAGHEFKELMNADDTKKAFDSFWLKLGENQETSRHLIKVYFRRVQDANKQFTSFTEGWKTDRGMIYIIFGKPQSIYSDGHIESWSYANAGPVPDVNFEFKKLNNPFTDNDYSLIRNPVYESAWYLATDRWRQARISDDAE